MLAFAAEGAIQRALGFPAAGLAHDPTSKASAEPVQTGAAHPKINFQAQFQEPSSYRTTHTRASQ